MHVMTLLRPALTGFATVAAAFASALALTTVLVVLTIHVCRKHGWVVKPRPNRWHKGTPASFGGVPMWLGFMTVSVVFLHASDTLAWKLVEISSLVFALGLVDDIFQLRPWPKFLVQLFAAALVVGCGVVYPLRGNWGIDALMSLVWIVGITNAFNLLDNMDGLSAGTALISSFYLIVFYVTSGLYRQAVLVSLVAGVIAGFLIFNFNPARIFMGDGGSLFIGFMLGTVSLLGVTHISGMPTLVLAPIAVLAVPILDTCFVSATRRLRGQPVSVGGTDHLSHRLVRLGLNERNAVLLLYALTALSGAVALAARHFLYPPALGLIALWFLFLFLFGVHLFCADASSDPHAHPIRWLFPSHLLERDTLALLLDPVVLSISYYFAYFLRFQTHLSDGDVALFLRSWPIVLAAKFACLWLCRIYRHSWWRGSPTDAYRLGCASLMGEVVAVLLLVAAYRFAGYSRVVFLVDWVLSWGMLLATRRSFGLFREAMHSWSSPSQFARRVFVLGTSENARFVLRFLREHCIECVGLIDTNGGRDLGRFVWGTQVVGRLSDLMQTAREHGVFEAVLPENEALSCSEAELRDFFLRDHLQLTKLGLYFADGDAKPRSQPRS